jgi:shikimate dehydrogenase
MAERGFGISGATRLVGVMGWPVSHSLSPRMQNAAFAALGLDWAYVPFPVPPERLAEAVRGLVALGFAGSNATIPHKPGLVPLMDELTPIAANITSVNTILIRPDGSLLGDSTDGYGFLSDLAAHGVRVGDIQNALVIGAGGAARAVAYALAESGASVAIANRTLAAADELCRILRRGLPHADVTAHPFPQAVSVLAVEAGLIVNTTSLGLHGDSDPLPWDPAVPFRPGQVVYDLIYNVRTPLLKLAGAAGAQAIDGLGMLVHQGARSAALWTGQDESVLARIMEKELREQ